MRQDYPHTDWPGIQGFLNVSDSVLFFCLFCAPFAIGSDFSVDVGHSWWQLKVQDVATIPVDLRPYVNVTAGYYPAGQVNPVSGPIAVPGLLRCPDGGHAVDVSKTFKITKSGLNAALQFMKALAVSPGTYNLNSNNCTTKAIQAAAAAGISIPATQGTWPVNGRGCNPGDLGEDLRGM